MNETNLYTKTNWKKISIQVLRWIFGALLIGFLFELEFGGLIIFIIFEIYWQITGGHKFQKKKTNHKRKNSESCKDNT